MIVMAAVGAMVLAVISRVALREAHRAAQPVAAAVAVQAPPWAGDAVGEPLRKPASAEFAGTRDAESASRHHPIAMPPGNVTTVDGTSDAEALAAAAALWHVWNDARRDHDT